MLTYSQVCLAARRSSWPSPALVSRPASRIPTVTARKTYSSLVFVECLVSVVRRRSAERVGLAVRSWGAAVVAMWLLVRLVD